MRLDHGEGIGAIDAGKPTHAGIGAAESRHERGARAMARPRVVEH